jgi:hypothetical protein
MRMKQQAWDLQLPITQALQVAQQSPEAASAVTTLPYVASLTNAHGASDVVEIEVDQTCDVSRARDGQPAPSKVCVLSQRY